MLEEQIKKMIIRKYGSIRSFALKIDIPYTTIDTILRRGIDNSNVRNVIKMGKELKISADKLIDNNEIVDLLNFDNAIPAKTSISNDMVTIPVLGVIKAGIPIEAQENIIEYIEIPKKWTLGGKQFYGLKISGDSMFPKYNDKDTVIFEKTLDMSSVNNKDCAVMVNGDDATFKKVLLNNNGIVLIPYNGNYDTKIYSKEEIEKLPVNIVGIAREKRVKID